MSAAMQPVIKAWNRARPVLILITTPMIDSAFFYAYVVVAKGNIKDVKILNKHLAWV